MLKTFLSCCVILTSFSAFATEMTSPFYLPQAGHLLIQTGTTYTKNKIKTAPSTRTYRRALNEEITVGLSNNIALLLGGDLNWMRQKQMTTFSTPRTTGYETGLKVQGELGGILTQLTALYHQQTNANWASRRNIETHARLGKTFQEMTPYLHLQGTFPMNARSDFNTPIYRGETGVFQNINSEMTLDSALYLQYDKNTKERSYGIRGEYAYLPTKWMALSINGEWQARGKVHHQTKTYHQSIGTKITFSF